MHVVVRKMGNSQGILIPKSMLRQLGFEDLADLQINGQVLEIRPVPRNPREGWAHDSQRVAAAGDDALVWPETGLENDADLQW